MPIQSKYIEYYVKKLLHLFANSENKVPVVGYIDLSFAKEVISTLCAYFNQDITYYSDAALFAPYMNPSDRTCAFRSKREILKKYKSVIDGRNINYSDQTCFTYVKIHSYRPAGVEFPMWILNEGELDDLINIICASSIVGGGYPYELSKAHENASLGEKERAKFFQLVRTISNKYGLPCDLSLKNERKRGPIK